MHTGERRVLAALWSLNGVGLKSVERIRRAGGLANRLSEPTTQWARDLGLSAPVVRALLSVETLEVAAEMVELRARQHGQAIVFAQDAAWPPNLTEVDHAPPLLFMVGPGAEVRPRRRLALVGTRHPEPKACEKVFAFAEELARAGLGIVSGAAEGIDQSAHLGALKGGGETWAFLGSAIDEMDPAQRVLWRPFMKGQGTFFSQYPPGTRADQSTFSRRNRLISGASDAVLVARAPRKSGALQTAEAAQQQGRPLLAMPSDPWNVAAVGSNELLRAGARVCLSQEDVLAAVGLRGTRSAQEPTEVERAPTVSAAAAEVLTVLSRHACDVDELCGRVKRDAGQVSAALLELEVEGYAVQRGGGMWEKR